jgi:hypothetical protein
MKNEITEAKTNALTSQVDLGMADELTSDDIQRGRISILQKNSRILDDRQDLRPGFIVNTSDGEILNDGKSPLEFIIVDFLKYWMVKDADTDEFIEKIPAINEKELKWEENVGGRNLKRTYHFSYIVLLPQDIAQGIEMPYELAFRSTSIKQTKKINSILMKKRSMQEPSWFFKFKLTTTKMENKNNTWLAPVVDLGDATNEKERAFGQECRKQMIAVKNAILAEAATYDEGDKRSSSESHDEETSY